MNENIYKLIVALIPIIGTIITAFVIPYIRSNISANQMNSIVEWVSKAVQAAEVMFNVPQSGEAKREYVIDFIDKMFNSKKEVISRDQIRVLLEAAWKEMQSPGV